MDSYQYGLVSIGLIGLIINSVVIYYVYKGSNNG